MRGRKNERKFLRGERVPVPVYSLESCCHVNVTMEEKLTMMTLLNRLHSNARAKHPYNLLILISLVKILSNYFVRRYCIIDKNVSGVCPNGKGPPS